MPVLAITRLTLRSTFYIPLLIWEVQRAVRQAKGSDGLMAGAAVHESGRTFWTLSLWKESRPMYQYVGTGAHLSMMPKLRQWCEESTNRDLPYEGTTLPTWEEAYRLMNEKPKFSFLIKPNQNHQNRVIPPPRKSGPIRGAFQ
jgi:hypothetical protein